MTRRKELAVYAANWWAAHLEANSSVFSEILAGLIEDELEVKKTLSINCSTNKADQIIRKAAKAAEVELKLDDLTMVVSTNPNVGILVSKGGFIRIHK